MDALAADKTGTLTKNELSVAIISPRTPYTEADLIRFAALASDDATQDPIDLAILAAVHSRGVSTADFTVRGFVPFDPSMKYSEALVQRGTDEMRIIKGAPSTIVTFVGVTTFPEAEKLAGDGYRVWAVAAGSERHLTTVGFLALLDPPRDDSGRLVANLQHLGVRV